MALTITPNEDSFNIFGTVPVKFATLAPGVSDYPAGGYVLSGNQFGLAGSVGSPFGLKNGIRGVIVLGCNTAAIGYVPQWNSQTGAFEVLVSPAAETDPLEPVATNANLTGLQWNVLVLAAAE